MRPAQRHVPPHARSCLTGLLLALCTIQALAAAAPAIRRQLTAEDLYRVQDLSDPQVSPDGGWVAYVVTTSDRNADEARSAIWMVSWDGTQRTALTAAADGTGKPRWSPDGRYLAFTSKPVGSDREQIMLLDRRGGDVRALTNVGGILGEYAWSPDGKSLACSMQQGDASAGPKPLVIDALYFKQNGDGYLARGSERHLYLIDVESKHVDPLTSDPAFNDDLPVWSPDGRRIAFVRTHEKGGADEDGRADIDVIEARAGSTPRNLVHPFAPNKQKLAWSPDGRQIAFLQGLEPRLTAYIQDRLFMVPAAGGEPRPMTGRLDRAVTSFAFTADSAAIIIAVEDDGTVYPARLDLASGEITRQVAGRFVVSELSAAAGHTALLESDDGALAEVHALEAGGLRPLTAHNEAWLRELQLGAVEDIRFKSKDGTPVHGLLVKPASFVPGRQYPMLVWIHGGPVGQDEHSLVLDGYQFPPQLFAAKGFVVLRVNYRGSSGRGGAYAKAIFADWGHKEIEDLLAGTDHLVAQGFVDASRLAIGGWSYGAMLTDYSIATDGRFKAAISGGGSADQIAMYGSDDSILQYNNELGPPWKNIALWLKVSYPFFHADRIHTPTLFVGGDQDFRVPINGGEQMYQALRTLGVPAQLVVYPGEHHVFTRPSFIKDLAERMQEWIDRYIAPVDSGNSGQSPPSLERSTRR